MAQAQASYVAGSPVPLAPPGSLVSYRPLAPASLDRVFFSSRRLSDLGGDTARTLKTLRVATRPRKDLNQLRRSVTRLTTLSRA